MPIESPQDYYKDIRKLANDNVVRSGESLDRAIFAILFGYVIAGSGFLENLKPSSILGWIVLVAGFLVAGVGLVSHLVAFNRSKRYNTRVVKELDAWWNGGRITETFFIIPERKKEENQEICDNIAYWLTITSIVLFSLYLIVSFLCIPIKNQQQAERLKHHGLRNHPTMYYRAINHR